MAAAPAEVRIRFADESRPPGGYSVEFSAVAADGHPVTGSLAFTLVTPRTSTSLTTTAAPRPTTGASDGETSWWPWLAGGAGVAALAVATVVLVRRAARTED